MHLEPQKGKITAVDLERNHDMFLVFPAVFLLQTTPFSVFALSARQVLRNESTLHYCCVNCHNHMMGCHALLLLMYIEAGQGTQ